MKLASLKSDSRDGTLVVVSGDLRSAVRVEQIAPTLQAALDRWSECEPALQDVYESLNAGHLQGSFPFDEHAAHSPLPRAYLWCEASVWIVHLERCRKSTNRELPSVLYSEIAMAQSGSDSFSPPRGPILCFDDSWDIDLEAGICVITDDVPMGVTPEEAASHIKLVLLVNDVSLRKLQYPELAKGFGVLISKPANAYSPVAVSPETLGAAWSNCMLARPINVSVREQLIGNPRGDQDALFNFPQLISHLATTRDIEAGAIIGAGTVANRDPTRGAACLVEKRAVEILEHGSASTPFLKFGDRIRIECLDDNGGSVFGAIEQVVTSAVRPSARR